MMAWMPRLTVSPTTPWATWANRLAGTGARLARTVVVLLLALVVVAAGVLLAVPQWRAAMLPSGTVTYSAGPPAGWKLPATASPPALPLDELAAEPAPSAKALAARIARLPAAAAGTPGVVVIDPATGKTLIDRADRALIPASTMKLLTCLVALESLGNSRRFATTVVSPRDGVVILRGGGDPLLHDARHSGRASLQDLASATAKRLKAADVTKVTLGYDASLFTGRGWHPRWTENYRWSVAPISALTADGGRTGTGQAEADPARVAARKFAKRLARAGIKVTSAGPTKAPSNSELLASADSATVEQLIEHTLRTSDNTAAETLARQVALASDRSGSFAGATAAVRTALRKLDLWAKGMVLDDSSGLSRNNRVTPGALAGAMRLVMVEAALRPLAAGLPVGGVSGTLFDRFDDRSERAGRGVVRAKTGSLRDVSALAGYLITADGAPLVYALMANKVVRPFVTRDWIDRTTAAWASCGC